LEAVGVTSSLCGILLWDAFAPAVEYFWRFDAISDVLDPIEGARLSGRECEVRRVHRARSHDRAADVCVFNWSCCR
jgi:hypothetical protein